VPAPGCVPPGGGPTHPGGRPRERLPPCRLNLPARPQEEDDQYTNPENITRKKLEVEVQANETDERRQRREVWGSSHPGISSTPQAPPPPAQPHPPKHLTLAQPVAIALLCSPCPARATQAQAEQEWRIKEDVAEMLRTFLCTVRRGRGGGGGGPPRGPAPPSPPPHPPPPAQQPPPRAAAR